MVKMIKIISISVPEIHCNGCISTIKNYIFQLDGILDISVSLANKTLLIKFDPKKVSKKDIIEKIVEAGFSPEK